MGTQSIRAAQTSSDSLRKVSRSFPITTVVVIVLVAVCVCGGFAWNRIRERGFDRDAKLKQIGVLFKTYVNKSKGERFPPLSSSQDQFCPDIEAFRVAGLDVPQDLAQYLAGEGDVALCYLGFAVNSEPMAQAVLDEYEAHGPEPLRQDDISLTKPINVSGVGETSNIFRLREGVGRFFTTEIMNALAHEKPQSRMPVLWEVPDPPKRSGGWVLYMDGHVEWKEYPGEFPMTERFIERVKKLTASGEPK